MGFNIEVNELEAIDICRSILKDLEKQVEDLKYSESSASTACYYIKKLADRLVIIAEAIRDNKE